MIKYDLFKTTDGTLHRVNLLRPLSSKVETLYNRTWHRNKHLPAAWFYDGKLLVRLFARNAVFKDSVCSQ